MDEPIKLVATKQIGAGIVQLYDASLANWDDEYRVLAIAQIASISYGREQAKDPYHLWRTLIKLGHESPFEFIRGVGDYGLADLRNYPDLPTDEALQSSDPFNEFQHNDYFALFKLKVPIFVARQIMRHRTFSYMEMSRRYTKPERVSVKVYDPEHVMDERKIEGLIKEQLKNGVPMERARLVMPIASYTQFWMMGDYRAYGYFFLERLQAAAQHETRDVAQAMLELLKQYQPKLVENIWGFIKRLPEVNRMFQAARVRKLKNIEHFFVNENNRP